MRAKDRPLSESEKREREEAREVGRRMANETIKKLEPKIKALADVINEANDRIYEDGRKAGVRRVVEVGDNLLNDAYWRGKLSITEIKRFWEQLKEKVK